MIVVPLLAESAIDKVLHFFSVGGFFMIPLVLCSIVLVFIIVLKGITLRRSMIIPMVIENEIERIAPGSSIERLSRFARTSDTPLGAVVSTALDHLKWPRSENMEAVQTKARHKVVEMEAGLVFLEVIVGVAPLIGLLGTLSGLVHVFDALGGGSGTADPRMVAHGIAEALNTTIAGLMVAVPALIGFSYFSKKIESMTIEIESIISELLAKCYSEASKPISAQYVPESGPPPLRYSRSLQDLEGAEEPDAV